MFRIIFVLAIYLACQAIAFSSSLLSKTSVPFQEVWIGPKKTLNIIYQNKNHWDAIVCGCRINQECSSYVATWEFKNNKIQSIGPNYLNWLELYLGLPPESPPQNADQNGLIQLYNSGDKPLPISCNFTGLGQSNRT